MGILNFSKKKPTGKNSNRIQGLFELDFDSAPNDEFHEQGEPIEIDGKIVRTFSKSFIEEADFELGLFDAIDIKTFEGIPNKNFIFTNETMVIGTDEINLIEKLTNKLYQNYGKNDDGNRRFSQKDIEDIRLGYWHRKWSGNENLVMLNFDDEMGLSLTIWITE